MAAFEYKVVHIEEDPSTAASLRGANDLGRAGWEAYAVTEDQTGFWLFLKRPAAARKEKAAK
jgi:hypothetical protein